MPLPVRTLILAMLLVAQCLTHHAMSQTPASKNEANASVSGKVTINGKPAAGVVVGMHHARPERTSPIYRTTTNEDGIYRINNIASGNYQVAPVVPGMLVSDADNPNGPNLIISAGDNVESIDFNLIRGGVITGKITDSDGRPLIEEGVTLVPVEPQNQRNGEDRVPGGETDDRGIYRMFGIRPGRYKVLFTESRRPDGDRRRAPLPMTYYPDVTDPAKATVIEVEPGSEASNVDIKIGPRLRAFSVSGRVVESDTGEPVPNVTIYVTRSVVIDNQRSTNYYEYVDVQADGQGRFQIPAVQSGKHRISIFGEEGSGLLHGPTEFEVFDSDVTDLIVKANRGALVSGVLVLEGTKTAATAETHIFISVKDGAKSGTSGTIPTKPDGSFVSWALPPGIVSFSASIHGRYLNLRRIERDGIVQPNAIPLQKGEHISGLRLFANYSNGSISGTIKIINGTLPPGARLTVQAIRPEGGESFFVAPTTQADARGHFLLEGLVTGSYELTVVAQVPNSRTRPAMSKQTVTVTDGVLTDVMVTLDLTPPVGP